MPYGLMSEREGLPPSAMLLTASPIIIASRISALLVAYLL